MENESLQKELCVLLCHYMKTKFPDVYEKLTEYVEKNGLLPEGCRSVEDALELRYSNFPSDHFLRFVATLRTDDDFPSIFRRIVPFQIKKKDINLGIIASKRVFCHRDSIYCMEIDPLSRILVTGSDDFSIKIFKLPEMQMIKRLAGHEGVITNISINALCTMLISSSHDKTIRIWSLVSGECISVLSGFTFDVIHSAVFSPSGSMIAAACEDGTVPLWTTKDAIQGKPPCRIMRSSSKKSVAWVTFSPGGEFLAFSSEPSNVTVVPMKRMIYQNLVFHTNLVDYLQFTNGFFGIGEYGPRLLTISNEDGMFCCWQVEAGQWKMKYMIKHSIGRGKGKILKTALDCEERVVLISRSSNLFAYDLVTGETIGQFPDIPICEDVQCIAASPVNPEVFFIGNTSGDAALINTNTLKIMSSISHTTGSLNEAVFSSDGKYVYASDDSGCVAVFEVFNQRELRPKTSGCVESFQFESSEFDGKYEAPCMVDKDGKVLEVQPEKLDLRDLDLPVKILQAKFLNDTANELALVQRMITGEHPEPDAVDNHLDIAPPAHIPVSVETIRNPHGPNAEIISSKKSIHNLMHLDEYSSDDEAETQTEDEQGQKKEKKKKHFHGTVVIESDSDVWDLDKEDDDDFYDADFQSTVYSSDIPEGCTWTPWITAIVNDELTYVPQVGDEAFFIRDAYLPVAKSIGFDTSIFFPENDDSFDKPVRCSIIYLALHEKGALIKIAFNKKEFELIFPIPETEKFLVVLSQYKSSFVRCFALADGTKIAKVVKSGETVTVKKGKFVGLQPSFMDNTYKSVRVKWTVDGHDIDDVISPWEITFAGKQRIGNEATFITPAVSQAVLAVIDNVIVQEEYTPFVSLKNYTPEQLKVVPIPMSLNLFRERVNNAFYRSKQAMDVDIELLYSFAVFMFGEDSKESKIANRIIDTIVANATKAIKTASRKK